MKFVFQEKKIENIIKRTVKFK